MTASNVHRPELISSSPLSETWRAERGSLLLRWTVKGSVHIVVQGYGEAGLVPIVSQRLDRLVLQHKLTLFFDFWQMATYASEMRTEWTQWLRRHSKSVEAIHVVARSKLVTMGVAVANLALGGILTSHPDRAGTFGAALRSAGFDDIEGEIVASR